MKNAATAIPAPFIQRPPGARRQATLALLSLLAALPVAAQWSTESPLPTHLQIRGVAAPAPDRVFLATDDDSFDASGALFESNDGGASWNQLAVPFDLNSGLYGVFFLDGQHGWVWGNANYRTTDGGTSWEELPFLGSTYFLEFSSPSFGVATGNFGAAVSRDGGASWVPSPQGMTAFSFADALTGLGVAPSGLFRTVAGGETLGLVRAGAAGDVAFLSPTVAVGIVDGALVRSLDGGATGSTGGSAVGRSRLFAVSADVALAWGRSGSYPDYDDRILRTADGGATWSDLGEVIAAGPFAASFGFTAPGGATVIASNGAGDFFRSADAGLSWTQTFATPGPTPGFGDGGAPVFADSQTGYAGFGAGFVLRTTDSGTTWTQISSGSGTVVLAMDRFANGDLIAVGETGEVLTRTAGNAPWRIRSTLGGVRLEAVQVVGAQAVVTVDSTSVVYRSADAGATWSSALAAPAV